MTRYLKPDEAAALIGIAPKTLANWRAAGYGPPFTRAGKGIRYQGSDLITWMEVKIDEVKIRRRGTVLPPVSPLNQVWPRTYCDSKESELQNWRGYFLTRIEVQAPAVLRKLRADLLTLYCVALTDCFFDELTLPYDETVQGLHRELVASWSKWTGGEVSKSRREMLAVRFSGAIPHRDDYSGPFARG